jgi:L-threonylcarbamoyladenylate synthase
MSLPIKKPSVRVINQAARIIKAGGIVAFPTETVYGLGANAYNIAAVKKIFNLKGRPNDNPIIIHIADHRDLARVARNIPQIAYRLVAKFWPGPLTLVLKKSSSIPRIVTAGRDTVAVRMPKSKIAIALIKKSGVPIAAPSANRSGRPSPVTARHVYEDFGAAAPMIIDGGQSRIGLESTVLDLTQKSPTLLRFGLITKKDIERCLGVKIKEYSGQPKRPASPGLKYRHYAPQARVLIIASKPKLLQQAKLLTSAGQRVGIVTTSDWQPKLAKVHLFRLGSKTNLRQAASKIFTIFRTADRKKIDTLLIRPVSRVGIGQAIMDRLNRASQK